MKKFILAILFTLSIITIAACDTQPKPAGPVINGAEDITIYLNEEFDPMEGVTATDAAGNDITDQIVISGVVETDAVGTYFLRYTVQDSAGNISEETRYVTVGVDPDQVGDEIVPNGDFSLDMAFWSTTTGLEGGLGNFSVVEGELKVEITAGAATGWEPRLENIGITFEEGQAYRVSFDARAEEPRAVRVMILELLEGPPWYIDFKPGQLELFELTTTMETYSFDFLMGLETTENGAITFEFGELDYGTTETTVYLDNVIIEPIDEFVDEIPPVLSGINDLTILLDETFDPMDGVTAFDNIDGDVTENIVVTGVVDSSTEGNYVLTYTVSDEAGNITEETRTITVVGMIFDPTDIITNGDFTEPIDTEDPEWTLYQADWDPVDSPMSEGSLTIENDQLVLEVIDVGAWGPMSWVLQAIQQVELEQGYTYKVVFSAKADAPRELISAIGFTDEADNHAWNGFGDGTFNLTTELETYEYIFTVDKDSGQYPIDFKFEFGQATDTVYIDFVEIQVWEQSPLQTNGTFDDTGWFVWHQYWGDAPIVEDGIVDGEYVITSSNSLGDANWAIQFVQEGQTVEEGTTYRVTFDARADHIRDINFKFIDSSGKEFMYVAELSVDMETYTFDFLYDGTADDGKISIELGAMGEAVPGTTIFDNISMFALDTAEEPEGPNLVVNGTFDQVVGWNSWHQNWDEGAGYPSVDVNVIEGELVLDYDGLGNFNWSIQFFQTDIMMNEGGTYTIHFDMKADHARAINFKMIGAEFEFEEQIMLSTEMVTYTVTFVYGGASGPATINFEFGVLPDAESIGTITMNNILLYRNFNN